MRSLRARFLRQPVARRAWIAAIVLLASAGYLPGQTADREASGNSSEDDAQPRLDLGAVECRALYAKQLELLRADPDNPLYAALQANADAMTSEATRGAEIRHCLRNVSRQSFICQMDAKNALELFQCEARHGLRDPVLPQADSDASGGERPPADGEEVGANGDPESGDRPRTETLPGGSLRVTPANCRRAYDRIYRIVTESESFADREDRDRLREYWQSEEAQASFQQRCESNFRAEDLGCIMRAGDADVVQGCLLVIPDE